MLCVQNSHASPCQLEIIYFNYAIILLANSHILLALYMLHLFGSTQQIPVF